MAKKQDPKFTETDPDALQVDPETEQIAAQNFPDMESLDRWLEEHAKHQPDDLPTP